MSEGPPEPPALGVAGPRPPDLVGLLHAIKHQRAGGFVVLSLRVDGSPTLVTAVGELDDPPAAGTRLGLWGRWLEHPRFGRQFGFRLARPLVEPGRAGVLRRLMSYPGVKQVIAERIVARFGDDALTILERAPKRLLEVEGIGAKTLAKLQRAHAARTGPTAALEDRLLELGLPVRLAKQIVDRYGDEGPAILAEQPFRLAAELRGIGFATADRIARAVGIRPDDPQRVLAGLAHALDEARRDGHCGLPAPVLLARAGRLLAIEGDPLEQGLATAREHELFSSIVLDPRVAEEPEVLWQDPELAQAEQAVAEAIVRLATAPRAELGPAELEPAGPAAPGGDDPGPHAGSVTLSPGQQAALRAVVQAGVAIVTGGPGTGKSTLVRAVIEWVAARGVPTLLCAPTGRAAKRLEQATGRPATTIHRLLEFSAEHGGFSRGPERPLDPGLVVVDEVSMLDVELARALLGALTERHRLLMIGDADQLPSVGPGNLLGDLLAVFDRPLSPVAVARLTEIFRQAAGSSIVVNAHRVLAGEVPIGDDDPRGELFVVRVGDPERAARIVLEAVTERIPAAFGLDPRAEIQVLCPMHRGPAGTEALNEALASFFAGRAPNPPAQARLGERGPVLRVGDRVMQTRNDHERGVFNGDIGWVVAIEPERERIELDFDGVPLTLGFDEATSLKLAYAATIHKAQGSEFPAVVIPLLREHSMMLRRNLLYTAITRARRLCMIVGEPAALARAVARGRADRRHTGLATRLARALGIPRRLDDPAGSA